MSQYKVTEQQKANKRKGVATYEHHENKERTRTQARKEHREKSPDSGGDCRVRQAVTQ